MPTDGWMHSCGSTAEQDTHLLTRSLADHDILMQPFQRDRKSRLGVCIFNEVTPELTGFLQLASATGEGRIIAISRSEGSPKDSRHWDLLQAGASDVLVWSSPDQIASQIKARHERWLIVEQLMATPTVTELIVAESQKLRATLREIVEISRFSNETVLILGESGTGKEVVARLIHLLDGRPYKRELVVLDCSTIVPELSGSEFFGHERGAFTGASTERHGAFALADGGTLFLDEIGELSLPLQAQLLRVIQERTYKRVGGNTWHRSEFRLLCATNRDLLDRCRRGLFRADLYYRIAGCICTLPPLRERPEDIIPLAERFLRQFHTGGTPPKLDAAVRDYLLQRDYPGNVRDLQRVVSRLMYRHAGDQIISIGYVPLDERPAIDMEATAWMDSHFERLIQRAVLFGAGLKDIGRAAEDVAIRFATDEEKGNLQRAARRLRVTDRALQLRRANRRQTEKALPMGSWVRGSLTSGPAYEEPAHIQDGIPG